MLLNNNVFKILSEFSGDYSKKIYGGKIARKLKMNQKTVSNILNSLEKQNILKYSTEGKNKYYFLNKLNIQVPDLLKIIEIARKNEFIKKYSNIKELFVELEKRSSGILVIFGSYANLTNNEKSDLDIFLIGKIKEFNELEEKYHIKINLIKLNKDKFNKEDIFIKEVIKNHIILEGVEKFIELIW
ncbi:nucleotidyltransferase domain-containing protein [Patescibacteria group bacterium]|nr:nucleotidyltransferase domain-containing protein [Patescibacteria group bacterium]